MKRSLRRNCCNLRYSGKLFLWYNYCVNIDTLGFILGKAGEITIAFTVLSVHNRVRREQKIDSVVLVSMGKERFMGVIGLFFIVAGFALQLSAKFI